MCYNSFGLCCRDGFAETRRVGLPSRRVGRATVHAGFLHGSKRRLGNVKLLEKFRERIHIQPGWQTKQLLPTMQINLFGGRKKNSKKLFQCCFFFDISVPRAH